MVRSPDGNTAFFNNNAVVFQRDSYIPYVFIICLDLTKYFHTFLKKGLEAENMKDTDKCPLLVNTSVQAKPLLHSPEQAARAIAFYVNTNKAKYMCFKQKGILFTLRSKCLKLVNQFTYLGIKISSTKRDVNIRRVTHRFPILWKSDLYSKTKLDCFHAVTVSLLLYRCTTCSQIKC